MEGQVSIYSGGKRRFKNILVECLGCKTPFYHFKWDKQAYCSKECYYSHVRLKRPVVKCCVCGEEFQTRYQRKERNVTNFCSRKCYNKRRKELLKKIKRGTEFYISLIENASCCCGISENYLLQIHHIDGDNLNNEPDNIEVVCANCHILRHLKKRVKDGVLVYHPRSLTDPFLLAHLKVGKKG